MFYDQSSNQNDSTDLCFDDSFTPCGSPIPIAFSCRSSVSPFSYSPVFSRSISPPRYLLNSAVSADSNDSHSLTLLSGSNFLPGGFQFKFPTSSFLDFSSSFGLPASRLPPCHTASSGFPSSALPLNRLSNHIIVSNSGKKKQKLEKEKLNNEHTDLKLRNKRFGGLQICSCRECCNLFRPDYNTAYCKRQCRDREQNLSFNKVKPHEELVKKKEAFMLELGEKTVVGDVSEEIANRRARGQEMSGERKEENSERGKWKAQDDDEGLGRKRKRKRNGGQIEEEERKKRKRKKNNSEESESEDQK